MKLFKKLASIYSGSNNEEPMRQYIRRWIKSSVRNVTVSEDKFGNMYITKGESETYPCVVAHLDQVQDKYPKDYKVIETADIIFGYSPSEKQHRGLGADDKCGIWIALKMLKKHDAIKVAFFPGEEIGCQGSSKADMEFFNDVRFVIEPDRRGANDLINSIGLMDLCSEDFLKAIGYEKFGYKLHDGLMTDVEELKYKGLKVSCINMSCGYYDPHSEHEYVVKSDMINALEFVDHIIENCTESYPHEADTTSKYCDDFYGGWGAYDYYGFSNKKKRKGKGSKKDVLSHYNDEYWDEYSYFSSMIEEALYEEPALTVDDFMYYYEDEIQYLKREDIEKIFSFFKEDNIENLEKKVV